MALLSLVVILCSTTVGAGPIQFGNIFDSASMDAHIFWNLRLSRSLVAFMAGSGLAVCGMVFQALFLNTLATPYTLGVAGGASCGAALVIYLGGLPGMFVGPGVTAGALVGAACAMGLVLGFSKTRMGHMRHVMLLAGVAVSFFFSSLLLLIQSLASMYQSFQIIRWLMGGIAVAGYHEVLVLAPVLAPCLTVVLLYGRRLNLLLLGDDLAASRGLKVLKTKRILFIVVSVMVAAIVSVTGPIGFVGLVAPHICRLIWGGDHRLLGPASLLSGGILLVVCDTIARSVMAPNELPVGVITSMIGAPFFFFLLIWRRFRF